MEKIDGGSKDMELEARERLKGVFPECFVEGKLDIDKLLNMCGEYIDDDFEKYEFKWKGKNDSLKLAQRRSTGTLRPCKEESVDWDNTKNLYIEGDNLEVLKILQSSYYRQVKMIYIDPPYNTGNDFVYEDDFADPIARYKEVTSQTTKSNPETMGRYHTNWLNMMYPRLKLAATLLKDDGVCFISIDDNEVDNLKKVCNEVFGEENFVANFPWRKRTAKSDVPFGVSQDYEWILCYAKSNMFKAAIEGGTRKYYETEDFPGRPWRIHDMTKQTTASERPNSYFTMINPKTGDKYPCDPNRTWRITKDTFQKYYDNNEIIFPGDYEFLKISRPVARYFKDNDIKKAGENFGKIAVSTKLPDDIGMSQDGTKEMKAIFNCIPFSFPKSYKLIKYLVNAATSKDSLILDFFSGSATTAHAVMQLNAEDNGNRQFIMVQLPEVCDEKSEAYKAGYKNICEIGKERIRRAGKKILAEWKEKQSQIELGESEETIPPDTGFRVFKLDTSNLLVWDTEAMSDESFEQFQRRLDEAVVGIKSDRTALDMVYEIILKTGFHLTEEVSEIDINGKTVYSMGDAVILICLEENVTTEDVQEMAEYAPAHIVFAEKSFADTSALKNAEFVLKDTGIGIKFF
ncbi:MAG: site-specific DNA-methyltransferase [Firmicutes bacterium]|nr:site-specific DNA-methyltransferase [Bacillota bacterium]